MFLDFESVVYFDGVCGLCNRFVNFVLNQDKARAFRFAPLQGVTAREKLGPNFPNELRSILFVDTTDVHQKSTAVLRILTGLGGIWSVFRIFFLIPRTPRDWVYDFIARNRYRWFGKSEFCRMPEPGEMELFLP